MAIADGTAGAWTATTTRNRTVTLPAHSAGDMLLVRIGWKSSTPTTDVAVCNTSGWAKLGQFYNGGGASSNGGGGVLVAVFWKVATSSSETNPVIKFDDATSPTPGAYCAVTYTKAASEVWATPVGDGGSIAAATSYSGTIQSHVTALSGDMLDAFAVTNDNTTLTVPTVTQAGLTLDTVTEYPATALSSATSNDISADGCNRRATAGTSSAAAVVSGTNSVADPGAAWVTRLRVVFDFSGSTSASHSSSTSAAGTTGRKGTASVSHASATSVTGRKGASSAVTVSHATSTTGTGGGTASIALSASSATSATGRKGGEGTATIAHTSATTATGERPPNFDGTFSVDHATATTAQGAKAATGSATAGHTSATSAQGATGRAGSASATHASATAATGTGGRAGVVTVTTVTSVTTQGAKATSGAITIGHASSTAATGTAAEAHDGTWLVAHASSVAVQGHKGAASSIAAAHAIAIAIAAQRDMADAIAIAHVAATSTEGAKDGRSAVFVPVGHIVTIAGTPGILAPRSHVTVGDAATAPGASVWAIPLGPSVTVGDSVIGPGGRKASVGDTLVGAARLSVGGASTDGTTVGDS